MTNPFSPLRSPGLGTAAARIAKGALFSAGIAAAALLSGGEAKANGLFSCSFGTASGAPDGACADWLGTPIELGDKSLGFAEVPTGVGTPTFGGFIDFTWSSGPSPDVYQVSLDFEAAGVQAESLNPWTYVLSIIDGAASDPPNPVSFDRVLFSSSQGGNPSGDFEVNKIIADATGTLPTLSITTADSSNKTATLNGDLITVTLDATTCPQCWVNEISDSYTQRGVEVPGPLPILGAAAAFGASRRIRSRIKARSGFDTTVV